MDKRKLFNNIGKILSAISVIFIIIAVIRLGIDFSYVSNWTEFLIVLLACVVVKIGTVFLSGSAWVGWLSFFADEYVDRRQGILVYVKANIGKYLPGNVMHYVERNLFAQNLGISQKKMLLSTVCEIGGLVMIAFLMTVITSYDKLKSIFLYIKDGADFFYIGAALLIAVILGFVIAIWLYIKKGRDFLKRYKKSDIIRTLVVCEFKYASVLISLGVLLLILYVYLTGELVTVDIALQIICGFIVAWILGFVVPGASGGIGIRELALTIILGPIMGTEVLLAIAVFHRLAMIVGDFLAYAIAILLERRQVQSA